MACKIISIINMKGGVGKTTMTCNIAYHLSEQGKKVLIIDIDPQFNSTQTFINYKHNSFDEYFDLKYKFLTISEIFNEKRNKEILRKKETTEEKFYNEIIYKINDNLDIIPGDLDLIVDINANSADKLKMFFNTLNIKDKYDYIFFDCPPTWSNLTNIAVGLTDYYLIPSKIDDFSSMGIEILFQKISEKVRANPEKYPKCIGIVYTFLNPRNSELSKSSKINKFKEELQGVYDAYEGKVKSTIKPFDTEITYHQPVATSSILYDTLERRYSYLNDYIKDISKEFEVRINNYEIKGEMQKDGGSTEKQSDIN